MLQLRKRNPDRSALDVEFEEATDDRPERTPLADLLDIAAIEPHGLIVTSSGRYVRMLALDRVPNLFSAPDVDLESVLESREALCGSIPDNQEVLFLINRDPMPAALVGAEDTAVARAVAQHDLRLEDRDSARTRLRLNQMTAQTLELAATGDLGASWARHYAIVVWTPVAESMNERFADLRDRREEHAKVLDFTRHYEAASDSADFLATVSAILSDQEVVTRRVDGPEALSLTWERLHPAAGPHPEPERLAALCAPIIEQQPAAAAARRAELVNELCAGLPDYEIPEAGIDNNDPRWLRHSDGTLEEVLYLSRQPQTTDPWWLDSLSLTSLSSTLLVRIRPHERAITRMKISANARRKNDVLDTQERKGRRVTREDLRVIEEVEAAEDDMAQRAGATIYSVGIYVSLRCTWGDQDALKRTASRRAKEFSSSVDARLMRGYRTNLRGFVSTLSLGEDRLKRTTKWAHRNTANLIPLSSSRCAHDVGIPLGISIPHGTLERFDPFDTRSGTHVTVVSGGSGKGKTFTTNSLLLRAVSQGMRLIIVDRSSAAGPNGRRVGSHYDPILSLIPGSARVSIGADEHSARINPWDVADVANPPIERVEALLAIHSLLIGEAIGDNTTDKRLTADDRALLANGIAAVYERCARENRAPTESLLIDELKRELAQHTDDGMRSRITSLLVRLQAYWGDGLLAYLLDRPTNVPTDSPALLFDIAGVPDPILPAVLTIAMTYIDAEAERLQALRQSGASDSPGYFDTLCALVEEGWKVTKTRAGAEWMDEEARRSRHLGFWLIFITQQLIDLQGEGGEALLGQAAALIIHKSKSGTVDPIAKAAGLTDSDLRQIRRLTTKKGEHADAFVVTEAGRGTIRVSLSSAEYWAIASDPRRDQPLRTRALDETGGDPWAAIGLLTDPAWHESQHLQAA